MLVLCNRDNRRDVCRKSVEIFKLGDIYIYIYLFNLETSRRLMQSINIIFFSNYDGIYIKIISSRSRVTNKFSSSRHRNPRFYFFFFFFFHSFQKRSRVSRKSLCSFSSSHLGFLFSLFSPIPVTLLHDDGRDDPTKPYYLITSLASG